MNHTSDSDPDFSEVPSMVPDRDDIISRKRFASGGEHSEPEAPVRNTVDDPGPEKKGGSTAGKLFLGVALLACAGLGGLSFQQHRQITLLEQNNVQLAARVTDIEQMLSATGEDMASSQESLQGNLAKINSEIRKLWDVSNKRNRGWIEENQKTLKRLTTADAGKDKSIKSVQASVAALKKELASAQSSMAAQIKKSDTDNSKGLSALEAKVSALSKQAEELSLSQQMMSDQLPGKELGDRVSALQSRSVDIGKDIESINANRVQVNSRLNSLQTQLSTIEKKLETLGGTQ